MDHLATMRSFRRVVECGGFAKAARDLGLSPAGIAGQVKALEARLGAVLIQRSTRKMALTEAGARYYPECCRLLDELAALEGGLAEGTQALSGRLKVNAPLSFGIAVLAPLLARFMAAHPALEIELRLADTIVDAVGEGFDVSLRVFAELADSALVARRLAGFEQVMCAAPAYLADRAAPETPDDLAGHRVLAYSLADPPGRWRLDGPGGAVDVALAPHLLVNNSMMLRELLVAGLGIGSLPSFLAGPALAGGTLVRVLPDHAFARRHVFAVLATRRHLPAKVRAFVDFLAETMPEALSPPQAASL